MIQLTERQARLYNTMINKAAISLDDSDALKVPKMFKAWEVNVTYDVDERVRYEDVLYKVLQAHTSQATWTPDVATSLFAKVLVPEPTVIPDWEQPSSTNPYMKGDKVKHLDKVWVSTIDNNVWEPSVYGWEEITNS